MDQFTRENLKELIEQQAKPCVSIYLPTHRAGAETQQDPIRFKNLLKEAEDRLAQAGQNKSADQEMLEQAANQLLLDETFWQHQSSGLAVFIAPDLFRYYRLQLRFEEKVVIDDQFNVKPLFPLFQGEGRFYILALSQNEVRLLEGAKGGVDAVNLENVPTSLSEALKWDDPEKQLQHHTVSHGGQKEGGTGRPASTFHGQGVGTDDQKTNLLRYFRKVDKGLQEYLAGQRVPLVIAGVDYLIPIYREASTYPNLADQAITGNPDELRGEELHARAWEMIAPLFRESEREAAEQYKQQAGMQTGQTSNNVKEVVQAAYGGRVEQLFILEGVEIWGRYDRATNQVEVHQDRTEHSEDLLNTAAVDTFLNGGTVLIENPGEMPDQSPVAALLRY